MKNNYKIKDNKNEYFIVLLENFEEVIAIFEEELKTKERAIEELEYELEACKEKVAELEKQTCKIQY